MPVLKRTPSMKPSLGFNVGCVRKFGGVEQTAMVKPAIRLYLGAPPPARSVDADTEKPTGVVAARIALILGVDGRSCNPQIRDAVVKPIAVNVVNRARRPLTIHVEPSESVPPVPHQVNAKHSVTPRKTAIGYWPYLVTVVPTNCNAARKNASLWIVFKQLAQALRGKIVFSHDACPRRSGQRPVSVFSTARASLF